MLYSAMSYRQIRVPAIRRFARCIERITETGCWVWSGETDRKGYGHFRDESGRKMLTHRWSYEHFREPIPEGLTLDHLCRVRNCVNPWHLQAVTNRANVLRSPTTIASRNLAKQTCPKGHDYQTTVEGVRLRRRCPICQRVAVRDCMRRRRARGLK